MSKILNVFRKEHIGQLVYSTKFGTGVITAIVEDSDYPVRVAFPDSDPDEMFTVDGRYDPAKPPVLSFGTRWNYGEPSKCDDWLIDMYLKRSI